MKTLLAVVALVLIGCGGGSSSSGGSAGTSQVTGLWNGTSTATIGSTTNSAAGFTHVTAVADGEIMLGDFCGDGSGPHATMTSATEFSIHALTCPAGAIGSCSSAVLSVAGGSGAVANNTLSVNVTGTVAGCGVSANYTLTFTGHK